MKLIFCLQINTKLFYKLIVSFWVCVARQSENTQNNKFACLWNLSRKVWGMKLIFCLQINTKVFYKLIVSLWVCIFRHTKVPKITSSRYLCNTSRKTWRMKLIVCLQIIIKGNFAFSSQYLKDTYRKNTLSNKTEALIKSMNTYFGASGLNQLFIRDLCTQI